MLPVIKETLHSMATAVESDGEQQQQIRAETDTTQKKRTMISSLSGGVQGLETEGKGSGGRGTHNGLSFQGESKIAVKLTEI